MHFYLLNFSSSKLTTEERCTTESVAVLRKACGNFDHSLISKAVIVNAHYLWRKLSSSFFSGLFQAFY